MRDFFLLDVHLINHSQFFWLLDLDSFTNFWDSRFLQGSNDYWFSGFFGNSNDYGFSFLIYSFGDFFFEKKELPLIILIYYVLFLSITVVFRVLFFFYWFNKFKAWSQQLTVGYVFLFPFYVLKFFLRNIFYVCFYWVRKKTWIRLNFRFLELKGRKNYKHYEYQYVNFFYMKFMIDSFYSILLRLGFFLGSYFFKVFIFFFSSSFNYFFSTYKYRKLSLYLWIFLSFRRFFFLYQWFHGKFFSLKNYIQLEFFTYVANDRGFLGTFLYYLFTTLYYKIPWLDNNNNWENIEMVPLNFYSWSKKFIPMFFLSQLIKIFKYSFESFLSVVISLGFLLVFFFHFFFQKVLHPFLSERSRYFFHLYFSKIFLKKFPFHRSSFLLFFFFVFFSLTHWSFLIIFFFLFSFNFFLSKIKPQWVNGLYYIIGFSFGFFFDLVKNLLKASFKYVIFILLKLKYLFLLVFLYKIGVIYLLFLFAINWFSNNLEIFFLHFFQQILAIIFNIYDITNLTTYYDGFNEDLVAITAYDFHLIYSEMSLYIQESFLNRLITLNFRGIDFSKFTLETFNKTRKSATKIFTLRDFYTNLYREFVFECKSFFRISRQYFIYKWIGFYYLYLWNYSQINLFYYLMRKIYLLFYLLYIYWYFYLKNLYFYLVPLYILPKLVFSLFFSFYSRFYYWINLCNYLFLVLKKQLDFFFTSLFLSISLFFYWLSFFWVYFYNWIIFLNFFVDDLKDLVFDKKISLNFLDNLGEISIYYSVNKSLFNDLSKDLLMNYCRIPKNNWINFNVKESVILGSRQHAVCMFDIDNLNMEKIREYGILLHQIDDYLVMGDPEGRMNRYLKDRDNLLIFENIFLLIDAYYEYYFWEDFYAVGFDNYWFLNFFLRNLVTYYFIDLYLIFYLLFYLLIYFFFFTKNEKAYNINYMWKELKENLDYKIIKNDKLFINALNFRRDKSGKKKIFSLLFLFFEENWKKISRRLGTLLKRKRKQRKPLRKKLLNQSISNNLYLKKIPNQLLKNYFVEKNFYFNNKYLFYWKDLLYFQKKKFYSEEKEKDKDFLFFFLSLVFRKNKYSSAIFYYYDTFNKMHFFGQKEMAPYFRKTSSLIHNYFDLIIENLLPSVKKADWLLDKSSSLLLYEKDDGDMYSLNMNILVPYYEDFFLWVIFIVFLFYVKLHWRLLDDTDDFLRFHRAYYFKDLLINDNFMYLANLGIYWVNGFFMFDLKSVSYEFNDYMFELMKMKKGFRLIRPSFSFFAHNDPLYFYKKNLSYHWLILDKNYFFLDGSFNLFCLDFFRKIVIVVISFISYYQLFISKSFRFPGSFNEFTLFQYFIYIYKKNFVNMNHLIKFFQKKILFSKGRNESFNEQINKKKST